jgi:hypothetical protein
MPSERKDQATFGDGLRGLLIGLSTLAFELRELTSAACIGMI